MHLFILSFFYTYVAGCQLLPAGECADERWFWVPKEHVYLLGELEPRVCSDWLGSCSYRLTTELEATVPEIHPVLSFGVQRYDQKNLGYAMEQIEGNLLIDRGITGKGVKIGIIDGGFLHAPEDPSLGHFFEQKLVAGYKDYINPGSEQYAGSNSLDDDHGTQVWRMIGGKNTENGIQYGLATEATYYLARTDHGSFEKRLEEDYLISALEWMESEGVRLVNISLGYADGYSDPAENYSPDDMDGKTSMIARAVDHAFYEKNMLVVVSAGNEGANVGWRVVSTPGDAKGALSVGATKLRVWDKMDYSSIGPESLSFLKPNISAYSTSGTSFSAPIITGLAAGLMQLKPEFGAQEIKSLIEQAGNFYPYGNNYVGYGVPTVSAIWRALEDTSNNETLFLRSKKSTVTLRGAYEGKTVVFYHKGDSIHVVQRQIEKLDKNHVKVRRHENCDFTSVLLDDRVIEIDWIEEK